MRAFKEVPALLTTLAQERVLSVYLSAADTDPALRQTWRLRLAHLLDELAASVAEDERVEVDRARGHLERELAGVSGFLPGPGWLALATRESVRWLGAVPAPTPDLARWRQGVAMAPLLRALQQMRPVIVALVDSRRARVLRYEQGVLEEVADRRADTYIDDLTDRNASKRASTHTGARGETATDAADRILKREMEQMLDAVAEIVVKLTGDTGCVVVGGTDEAGAALRHRLAQSLDAARLTEVSSLYLTMTGPSLRTAVEEAASMLTQRKQAVLLSQVVDAARAGGRGALGLPDTRRAIEGGQVERLLVASGFARTHEADVETLVARCLDFGGSVEEVSGEAAADLELAGVAAQLRFAATAST
jgi:hypothetical protein